MQDPIDLLQIKIEKARAALPKETLDAIAVVDWKGAILGLRASKGYTFEQLGDLETETELLLCGLLRPEDYPGELAKRMRVPEAEANELASEMNNLVFRKIREELIKNTEREKIWRSPKKENFDSEPTMSESAREETLHALNQHLEAKDKIVQNSTGVGIVPPKSPAAPEAKKDEVHPILEQKLSGALKIPIAKSDYSLDSISKPKVSDPLSIKRKIPNADPYREIPE